LIKIKKELNNKNLYFLPCNNISSDFSNLLDKEINFNNFGFIDKNIINNNVFKMADISKEYDFIIVSSPNYYKEITKELIENKIPLSRILYTFELLNKTILIKNIKILNLFYYLKDKANFFKEVNFFKLRKLKNIHKNKRAFILGNGPSLCVEDLNKIKDEITFAANKIYLAFGETSFRPKYYFVEDLLVYEQNIKEISNIKQMKFFPTVALKNAKVKNGIYYKLVYENYYPSFPNISNDISKEVFWGATVIYSMIQFAIYMGIKELYLIGLDFNFLVPIGQENSSEIVSSGEKNHFHKNYRKVGEKWNHPKLEEQYNAFLGIREYCEKNEIKIYNASRSTKLDVFDMMTLEEILR
jgi:hypothetical protein